MVFDGGLSRPVAEGLALIDGESLRKSEIEADNPDRHSWPHTTAMNTGEIDTFTGRLHRFTRHGLSYAKAQALADGLVARDRQADDRRLCLECLHLRRGAGLWGCNQWQRAGLGAAGLSGDLVALLQRCEGFSNGGALGKDIV